MRVYILIVVFAFFAYCVKAQDDGQTLRNISTSTLVSLPVPQHFNGELFYVDSHGSISQKKIGDVIHDHTLLASFPNTVSSVTVYQVEDDGSLTLLGNTISGKGSVYEVIYDFTQTQSILLEGSNFELVGVSVRMVARVKTRSAGINLSSIEGLGVAASHKKVTGSLEVRANGISSQKINAQIPVTTDLSLTSISNALQSVAAIKSHIYDNDVLITPQVLAINKGIKNTFDSLPNTIQAKINSMNAM